MYWEKTTGLGLNKCYLHIFFPDDLHPAISYQICNVSNGLEKIYTDAFNTLPAPFKFAQANRKI